MQCLYVWYYVRLKRLTGHDMVRKPIKKPPFLMEKGGYSVGGNEILRFRCQLHLPAQCTKTEKLGRLLGR